MRILVTGGTGFIGSNIARQCIADGHEVLITGADAEENLPEFHGLYLQPSFLGLDWDRIGYVDAVFHEAAINDRANLDEGEMMRANVESSKALFEYVIGRGCKRIIYASSTAVYGNVSAPQKESGPVDPLVPYDRSKLNLEEIAAELARKHPDVILVGLRYCNVYGRGEASKGKRATMIYQLAQQMKKGNPRIFKYGEQMRDYIYVKDVVRANLLALKAKGSCVVNCGSGVATSFNRLVEILNDVMGLGRVPEFIDNPYEGKYQDHTECDMALAKEKIGFEPSWNIEDGIQDYYESGWL